MVVGKLCESFPVLWSISNREDCLMLTQLFRFVQKCIGRLRPKLFIMMRNSFGWNAWVGVFELNQRKKFLCAWHVDRACSHCHNCIYQYSCTCMDSLIHRTVCKHIHLVHWGHQYQYIVLAKKKQL